MQLKDILEREQKRDDMRQCCTIHLFQEGTFFRAYEWSAWLAFRYIKQFKPTRRLLKNSDASVVFVGFPVSSLEKYASEGFLVQAVAEKCVDVHLPESVFTEDAEVEVLQTDYENWKSSVPLTEASKKRLQEERYGNPLEGTTRLTDIMHRILEFPVEQKSPIDSMLFLAEIKQQIATII